MNSTLRSRIARRLGRGLVAAVLVAAGAAGLNAHGSTAHANGVPIRLQLTYLNGLSNWGPAEARGEAELSFAEGVISLDARGLPPAPGERYTLWLVKSATNTATLVGTLQPDATGAAGYTGKLTGLDGFDYDLLIVTVEPSPDNDPAPSAKRTIGGFFTPVRKEDVTPGFGNEAAPPELPKTGDEIPVTDGATQASPLGFNGWEPGTGLLMIGGGVVLIVLTGVRSRARKRTA